MFKATFTAALIAALATATSAMPNFKARGAEVSSNIVVCTGNIGTGCVTLPVISNNCINLTGGLSFLNKDISSAIVPNGFICTFFEQFDCLSSQGGADTVFLSPGQTDFSHAEGPAGTVNFNDKTSSFDCFLI